MNKSNLKEDLTRKTFNYWLVTKELGGGKVICKCLMCNKTEKELYKKVVKSGQAHMCKDCYSTFSGKKIDIIGKTFGNLKVIKPIGNGIEECKCLNCNNITHVSRANLLSGRVKNCRCLQGDHLKNTMMQLYGDISNKKIDNPREQWQIDVLHNSDKLKNYILSIGFKPTIKQLCERLNINESTALVNVHKAKLDDIVNIQPLRSQYEDQIIQYLYSIKPDLEIEINNRTILDGKELDLFIPKFNLAIEFNGNYWHSSIYKDSKYHQEKSLACMMKNIHLIHIFEYEWCNEHTQEKIKNYINSIIVPSKIKKIYARNTVVKELNIEEEREFLNKYHMQNYTASHLSIGLYIEDKLISVMSFGNSRFENTIDYEIIRYCNKPDIKVIGGAEKLLSYFFKICDVSSIVTYCDLSKFTGSVYKRLGFKLCDRVTSPGYVWVNTDTKDVLSRYKCQKSKLVKKGFGSMDQTETQIMEQLGYIKIYDSGNLKFQLERKS